MKTTLLPIGWQIHNTVRLQQRTWIVKTHSRHQPNVSKQIWKQRLNLSRRKCIDSAKASILWRDRSKMKTQLHPPSSIATSRTTSTIASFHTTYPVLLKRLEDISTRSSWTTWQQNELQQIHAFDFARLPLSSHENSISVERICKRNLCNAGGTTTTQYMDKINGHPEPAGVFEYQLKPARSAFPLIYQVSPLCCYFRELYKEISMDWDQDMGLDQC